MIAGLEGTSCAVDLIFERKGGNVLFGAGRRPLRTGRNRPIVAAERLSWPLNVPVAVNRLERRA